MAVFRCIMAVLLLIGNHLIIIVNSQLGDVPYKYISFKLTIFCSQLKYVFKFSKIFRKLFEFILFLICYSNYSYFIKLK